MYDLELTAEQIEIRDTVREFVRGEIKPAALSPSRLEPLTKPLLLDALAGASRLGLRTLTLADESGGAGADNLTSCIAWEELAAGDIDIATVLTHTSLLARTLFDELMTAEQRLHFLPRFIEDDDFHLAFAGRDPDSGLEAFYHRPITVDLSLPITAVKQSNGDWLINGEIPAVPNAPLAKLIAIHASTREGTQETLLVERGTPGLQVKEWGTISRENATVKWHHGVAGKVVLSDCRVPASHRLVTQSRHSLPRALSMHGAPQMAALNLGIGQAAYEAAVDQAKLRRQGGRQIIEHQAIGTILAEMAIKLEVARNMVWKAAWGMDHPDIVSRRGISVLPLHYMARVFTSEVIHDVTEHAAECFGAMGVMRDMPLQKYVGDALIFKHAAVSNNAAKLLIAEAIAGHERQTAQSATRAHT